MYETDNKEPFKDDSINLEQNDTVEDKRSVVSDYYKKSEYNIKKNKKVNKILIKFSLSLVLLLIVAILSMMSYNFVVGDKSKNSEIKIPPEKQISVDIPQGSSTGKIAEILKAKGIISNEFLFKLKSRVDGYDTKYKSGIHILSKDLTYAQIMQVLSSNPSVKRVLIPEGKNFDQIVEILASNKVVDAEKFKKLANSINPDFKFLKNNPGIGDRLEGYLFPDTYDFSINATENDVLNEMLKDFDKKFKPEYYEQAKRLGMTVNQVITLASIIEKEAQVPEERKIIAGVFYNRLTGKNGAPNKLQSCATVQYILLKTKGINKKVLSVEDTKINSPYNTYLNKGLPPGPICSPGEASIEAALYPAETDYNYFVAKGDGSHVFSKTYKEHLKAMKEYEVE